MPQVKEVFTSIDHIAHLWANKAQPAARNTQKNFFFENSTIYSYGTHFPIARHCTATHGESKGKPVILFTTETRSVTTAKHIHTVREAIASAATVYNVVNVRACDTYSSKGKAQAHKVNFLEMVKTVESTLQEASKAKSRKPELLARARKEIESANAYRADFGVRCKPLPVDDIDALQAEFVAQQARNTKAQVRAEKRRVAARAQAASVAREQYKEDLKEWLAGTRRNLEIPSCSNPAIEFPIEFRLIECAEEGEFDGETVETSRGAQVPAEAARGLIKRVNRFLCMGVETDEKCRLKADEQCRIEALEIGSFKIDSIHNLTGNFRAGCHEILWSKVEEFAKRVNWI